MLEEGWCRVGGERLVAGRWRILFLEPYVTRGGVAMEVAEVLVVAYTSKAERGIFSCLPLD